MEISRNEQAPQACLSCRKQKRKCDKLLPGMASSLNWLRDFRPRLRYLIISANSSAFYPEACGLCQRIGRICDYSADAQPAAPTPEDFAALQQQVADLQHLITSGNGISNGNGFANGNGNHEPLKIGVENGTPPRPLSSGGPAFWPGPSSFPSLYFLDSNAFVYEGFQIQTPNVKVPPGALTALGSSMELREMIEHYFATVHKWFPVVSKIRLYQHLANPLHEPGADIALLFLAMKLASDKIPEHLPAQTQLYQDVKSFYHYVESQNGFSAQMIQALLLIAVYEIGHSIYPAAYLSIGNAARLGYAAGIHDRDAPQMLPRCTTWTEQEERRRLWWGVVFLDRFVQIGNRGKPLACAPPSLDTILPTEDEAWDRGQMLVATPLALSASQTVRVSAFARTCQAAHIAGSVINHLDDKDLSPEYRFKDALQLHRTGRAFADVLSEQLAEHDATDNAPPQCSICTSMALTCSGLLTLYDGYSCTSRLPPEGGDQKLMMQQESIAGLREISDRAVRLVARRAKAVIANGGIDSLSPMVIDCIYQAAANYAWYVRESSDQTCGERLQELKELLALLRRRWKVADEYLRIVEATEFHLSSAIAI